MDGEMADTISYGLSILKDAMENLSAQNGTPQAILPKNKM